MEFIESEKLELKEKYTDNICKDIVAFLNAEGGTIVIGVTDNGEVVGITKIDETMKKLSDVITSQIEPNPQEIVTAELKFYEGKTLIFLEVPKGNSNIYCIKKYGFSSNGCLIRIGTTCRAMTATQIKLRYELNFADLEIMTKTKARYGDISLRTFKVYYSEKGYHLNDSSIDKNFNLRTNKGEYNLLAELLSDQNNIPLIFVKFRGSNRASISSRNDFGHGCLLSSYEKMKNRILAENKCISDTTTRPRKDIFLFDMDAVNEALINALVHNDWTISEPLVSMFNDRIEIFSHGSLPKGLTLEQFYEGVSKPRNTTLMRIFINMDIAEHTGHGVPAIVEKYGQEAFEITDNSIKCTIPFDQTVLNIFEEQNMDVENGVNVILNATEIKVLKSLIENPENNASTLGNRFGVTKRTIERTIKSLKEKGYIQRQGNSRTGFWVVVK